MDDNYEGGFEQESAPTEGPTEDQGFDAASETTEMQGSVDEQQTQDSQPTFEQLRAEKEALAREASVYREMMQQRNDADYRERQMRMADEQRRNRPPDPWEKEPPEGLVTVGKAREWMQSYTEGRINEAVSELTQAYREQITSLSEEIARIRYPDYDEVMGLTAAMIKRDPALAAYIGNSSNPALAAYKVGQSHESYLDKVRGSAAKQVVKKAHEQANKPPTLRSKTGAAPNPKGPVDWDNMPRDKFLEYKEKVKSGQRI